MRRAAALALIAGLGACSRPAPPPSCDDDLAGTWRSEAGERWMILENGALEIYPLFDDTRPAGAAAGLELGPRTIDLTRRSKAADGETRRRYMRAGEVCIAKAPAHLVACTGDMLELIVTDPLAPLAFGLCTWGNPAPSHRERWRRVSPTSTTR
jgi:hypothetical protein